MKLLKFPNLRQSTDYTCGITVIQAMCAYYGLNFRDDEIIKIVKPSTMTGVPVQNIVYFLNDVGISARQERLSVDDVIRLINDETPPIIMVKAYGEFHYVVPIGYDDNRIFFMDPSTFLTSYIDIVEFEDRFYGLGDICDGGRIIKGLSVVVSRKSNYADNLYELMEE